MKSKDTSEILRVMKLHLNNATTRPKKIWMDKERSAYSKPVLAYLASINVKIYSTGSPIKSAFAKSAVRIIKTRIEKWMLHANSRKYIPILSDLVTSYNNTVNTKTKFKPVELLNDSEKASEAW
jgi:hypothetical protein